MHHYFHTQQLMNNRLYRTYYIKVTLFFFLNHHNYHSLAIGLDFTYFPIDLSVNRQSVHPLESHSVVVYEV